MAWASTPTDTLEFYLYWDTAYIARLETQAVFRDPTAWYHVHCFWDTTYAGQAPRRMFMNVNGPQLTTFINTLNPPLNQVGLVNYPSGPSVHAIGSMWSPTYPGAVPLQLFDGLIADAHFIDGQLLEVSDFGVTHPATGTWAPKRYAGTYGVNGFHIDFSNTSSSAALGYDTSGNANNYSVTNLSPGMSSSGTDSFADTPTSYGAPAANGGGEVRGNYCTLNTLDANTSAFLGMPHVLKIQTSVAAGGWGTARGTMWVNSGKWWFEVGGTIGGSNGYSMIGVMGAITTLAGNASGGQYPGVSADSYGFFSPGTKYNNAAGVAFGSALSASDVVGVALDLDAGTISVYKNGALMGGGPMYTGLSGWFAPAVGVYWLSGPVNVMQLEVNFGQRPFAFAAPAGFKAWCSHNLPTPAILRGDNYMALTSRGGTQSGGAYSVTGVRFPPDIVWIKRRRLAVSDHRVFDTSRNPFNHLSTNQLPPRLRHLSRFHHSIQMAIPHLAVTAVP